LANSQIFSAVLRISDAAIARDELEVALGATVERYEPARTGPLHYAQVSLPIEMDIWATIVDRIQALGPRISTLRQERLIGPASIDLAVAFAEGQGTLSVTVPSHVAQAAGQYGIDIEFTVFAATEDR
jgi:hypothetical protein